MVYAYAAYGSLNYEICTENEILSGCYTVECDISTRSTGSCHFLVFHVWKEIQNKVLKKKKKKGEVRSNQIICQNCCFHILNISISCYNVNLYLLNTDPFWCMVELT